MHMTTIGAFEAKTHFSALLGRVEGGEEIIITKHGKPVARMVPDESERVVKVRAAIKKLRQIAERSPMNGLSWKELRDAGRKW